MTDGTYRQRAVVALALVALGLSILGLTRFSRRVRSQPALAPSAAPAPLRLAPLASDTWLVELEVSGFPSAFVAVPVGAREPRPVLIALHGGSDRAEWACGTWTGISKARPFVLCPRGKLRGDLPGEARYGWGTRAEVESELRAALKALKVRYAEHVASGPVVLVGFAAGVEHVLEIAQQEPPFFSRLVLVGAQTGSWSAGRAAAYTKAGGRRALWVVSDPESREASSTYWVFARGAGLDTKLIDLGDLGLVLDAQVAGRVAGELEWLVDGDPLYAAAPR